MVLFLPADRGHFMFALPLARWLLHRGIGVRILSHQRAEAWLEEEGLLTLGATFQSCGEFDLRLPRPR